MKNEAIADEEAERATLGAMMEDEKAIPAVANILTEKAFYTKSHQIIYSAILNVYNENGTGDIMLVAKEIKRQDAVNRIGGLPYLYDLLNSVVDTENVKYYAEIVQENYVRRQLVQIGAQFNDLAYKDNEQIEGLINKATEKLSRLAVRKDEEDYLPRIMKTTFERLKERREKEVKDVLIPTGFYELDQNQTVMDRGTMMTLVGDSGAGKSTLIRNIVLNRFENGQKTLMFTTEISKEMTALSYYCMLTGISVNTLKRIEDAILTDEQWQSIEDVSKNVEYMTGWVHSGNVTVENIINVAREKKMSEGLDCLVVDFVQNIQSSKYFEQTPLKINYICNQLAELSEELDIHVILVSQLSKSDRRYMRKKGDETPGEGAWGSGIKDNSTVLITMRNTGLDPRSCQKSFRESGQKDTNRYELIELKIDKDRYSQSPNSYPVVWEKQSMRFRDVTVEEKDYYYRAWLDILD